MKCQSPVLVLVSSWEKRSKRAVKGVAAAHLDVWGWLHVAEVPVQHLGLTPANVSQMCVLIDNANVMEALSVPDEVYRLHRHRGCCYRMAATLNCSSTTMHLSCWLLACFLPACFLLSVCVPLGYQVNYPGR